MFITNHHVEFTMEIRKLMYIWLKVPVKTIATIHYSDMRKRFSNCQFEVKHLIIVLRGLNIRTVQQKLWHIKEICFLLSDSDKRRNDVIWDAVEPFSRYELVSFAWQLLSAVFKYPPSLSARGFAELYRAAIIFYLFPTFIWVLSKRWSRGIAKQRGRRQRTKI